jgi:radical SAM protein with 4Fe4S-binding SPASM domain
MSERRVNTIVPIDGRQFIHTIELHFSNRCSGNCVVCSRAHGGDNQALITKDTVDAIIDNLKDIDFNWLQVGGDGDSFLSSEFFPALRRFREAFPKKGICLFSNGSMLTKERADTIIAERLLDDIQTRIDSLNVQLYKQSTGLNLATVIDNIKYFFLHNNFVRYHIIYFPLYAYRDTCMQRLDKEPTQWNRIDESLLSNEARGMREYFKSLPRNSDMSDALFNFRVSQICLWGEREDATSNLNATCTQLPEHKGCFRNQVYIYPDGSVGSCAYDDGQDTFILGNIVKGDRLADLWVSDKREQFISDIRNGKYKGKYPCTNPDACKMFAHDPSIQYGDSYERVHTVTQPGR